MAEMTPEQIAKENPIIKVTEKGIEVASFQELRESIARTWRAIFSDNLVTTPDSPDGHHIDIEARTLLSVAYAIQAVAANLNMETASGSWLDNIASLFGMTRNQGETDAELRERIKGLFIGGLATYDGMVQYLRQKLGASVVIRVNPEPENVDGMEPHSIYVYAPRGDGSQEERDRIAQAIWDCKPAGIRTYGNETGTAHDTQAEGAARTEHAVSFNYVTSGNCTVNITVQLYTEEQLPDEPEQAIKKSVAEWAAGEFTDGKDIFPQRILTPVYRVPGIGVCTIECIFEGERSPTHIEVPTGKYVIITENDVNITWAEN